MGERYLELERGGPKRLALLWVGNWLDIVVQLDGRPLGERIPDFDELKKGRDFTLPDGRTLHVAFKMRKHGTSGLDVTIDGVALPGLLPDPKQTIRVAAIMLWCVAGINLIAAAIGFSGSRAMRDLGGGWVFLAIGMTMCVLGWFVLRHRSRLAIALAFALELVNLIVTLVPVVKAEALFAEYILYLHIGLGIMLLKAYSAVAKVYKMERDALIDTFR